MGNHKKNILIAGSSGFIGVNLSQHLRESGYNVKGLTRSPQVVKKNQDMILWNAESLDINFDADIVINLCGKNITSCFWTQKNKQRLIDSRIKPTHTLVQWMKTQATDKKIHFINASAIGIYPSCSKKQDEDSFANSHHHSFTIDLVNQWEQSAAQAKTLENIIVSCIRLGVVLGEQGGFLKKVIPVFKRGFGCILGNPKSHLSWIHITDVCRAIEHIISQVEPKDSYNLTAPHPCTQKQFSDTLANAYHRKPLLTIPESILKLAFGDLGKEILCADQKVYPLHLEEENFTFKHPTISTALQPMCEQNSDTI